MVKVFVGVIFIAISTVLGKKITSKYLLKLKYYESLKRFNLHLKQNLMYKRDNLLDLLNFSCENQEFLATISSFKLNLYSETSRDEVYLPYWVDEEDKRFLNDYFNSLGKNNLDAEVEFVSAEQVIIDEKVKIIADNSSRFSNLGQKLGFSLGMVVFIIIL